MGLFHEKLENIVEDKSFKEILHSPLKSSWREIFHDLNYEELFSGSKKRKSALNDISILASFGLNSIPHEIIHAVTNHLTGGINEEIVINKLFGGDLVNMAYSGIQAKWLLPIIGGYVKIKEHGSFLGEMATSIAPYMLTPLGLYLIYEGKKRKSLPMAIAGSGAVISHAGGVIGDFLHQGQSMVYNTANYVSNTVGLGNLDNDNAVVLGSSLVLGFYVGSKILSFTYRSIKVGIKNLTGKDRLPE